MQWHVVKVKTNNVPQFAFKLFVNTVKKNRKPAGFSPNYFESLSTPYTCYVKRKNISQSSDVNQTISFVVSMSTAFAVQFVYVINQTKLKIFVKRDLFSSVPFLDTDEQIKILSYVNPFLHVYLVSITSVNVCVTNEIGVKFCEPLYI